MNTSVQRRHGILNGTVWAESQTLAFATKQEMDHNSAVDDHIWTTVTEFDDGLALNTPVGQYSLSLIAPPGGSRKSVVLRRGVPKRDGCSDLLQNTVRWQQCRRWSYFWNKIDFSLTWRGSTVAAKSEVSKIFTVKFWLPITRSHKVLSLPDFLCLMAAGVWTAVQDNFGRWS